MNGYFTLPGRRCSRVKLDRVSTTRHQVLGFPVRNHSSKGSERMGNTETVNLVHETELLLACARSRCDPQTTERIKTLCQKDLDWAYLIRLSFHHGVMPLLQPSLVQKTRQARGPGSGRSALPRAAQRDRYKNACSGTVEESQSKTDPRRTLVRECIWQKD